MSKENTYENFSSLDFEIEKNDIDLINNKFKRETLKIAPNKIKVIDFDESDTAHQIYTTVEEAISNNLGIKPSASELADEIKNRKVTTPIELNITQINHQTNLIF